MADAAETPEELRNRVLALLLPHFCHDLNNAIGVVQGLSELASRKAVDSRDRERLLLLFEHASKAADDVTRIGEYAAVAVDGEEPTDVGDVARTAASVALSLFRTSGGELELRVGKGSHVVRTELRRLLQVLVVLLAAPYTAARGARAPHVARRMRLTVTRSGTRVVVRALHASRAPELETDTARTIAEGLVGLDARSSQRSLLGLTCRRIALPALS